jgi:hypothetical protein
MLCNSRPRSFTEAPRKRRVCEETLDRLAQGCRIARRHEHARLPFDYELRYATDVRGDNRHGGSHRFQNRERQALGACREHEDVGCGEELADVAALAQDADRRLDPEASYFVFDNGSIRAITDEKCLKLRFTDHCERPDEGHRVLGRLEASNRDDATMIALAFADVSSQWFNTIADHDRGRVVTSPCRKSCPTFILGHAHSGGRQWAESPLDPPVSGRGNPPVRKKRPAVHGVDANGHACDPRRQTTESRCLRAVYVDDVGILAPQEAPELQQAAEIAPWVDGTSNVAERDEPHPGRERCVSQGALAMRRYEHVELVGDGREQGSDVSLRASGLGQRNQEDESWAQGRTVSR